MMDVLWTASRTTICEEFIVTILKFSGWLGWIFLGLIVIVTIWAFFGREK